MIAVTFFVHAQIERVLLQEEFDDFRIALGTASIQWGLLVLVHSIHIGSISE